jgi:hypothetical protein
MSGPSRLALPCSYCGGPGAKRCKSCRLACFCSRECLQAAWPQHSLVCNSKKRGYLSPAPKLELFDAGKSGAGLRAVTPIRAGEQLLLEEPLLLTRPEEQGQDSVPPSQHRQHRQQHQPQQSAAASAARYAYQVLAGLEAFYAAPEAARRTILTELYAPVAAAATTAAPPPSAQVKEVGVAPPGPPGPAGRAPPHQLDPMAGQLHTVTAALDQLELAERQRKQRRQRQPSPVTSAPGTADTVADSAPEPPASASASAGAGGGEGSSVIALTLRNAEAWRDAAWMSWAGRELGMAEPLEDTPPEQRYPPWLGAEDFVRYLLILQANMWHVPMHVPRVQPRVRPPRAQLAVVDGAAALLRLGSKFNHSCAPNVGFSWQHVQDQQQGSAAAAAGGVGRACFTALRDVASGEELLVSCAIVVIAIS